MRITQHQMSVTSLRGLNRNMQAVNRLQEQLTSGRSINKPSDDPTGTNSAMQTRQQLAGAVQYGRNISDGISQLDATDATLRNMMAQVQKVRELAVAGSNDGSLSTEARSAIGLEVSGLRGSLLGLANSRVQNQPLFGGVTAGPVAYDVATGAYVGVGGTTGADFPVTRQVSDAESVRVDITGPEAFGVTSPPGAVPASRDLFAIVGDIADHVVNDTAALAADLDDLDVALQRLSKASSDIGTRTNRIETAQEVNSDLQLTLTSRSADIENVDLAKTIMNLNMQQTSYQAALQTTAKVIQPTLLDFLR